MSAKDYKALAESDVVELLSKWQGLNDDLLQLSEAAVAQLLRAEVDGARRSQFIKRLHHRYNRLRMIRERNMLKVCDTTFLP